MFSKLKENAFLKNVAVLLSGTAIAQGIVVAAAPILTRIYEPELFGTFALFTSAIAILSVFTSWKYEMSIVLADHDREATNIIYLSTFILIINISLIILIILFFGTRILNLLGAPELESYLWWIPTCVSGAGLYQILNYWTIRTKAYKRISSATINKSISEVLFQIFFGKVIGYSGGLIAGYTLGRLLSAFTLGRHVWLSDKSKFKIPEMNIIKRQIKKYRDFPLYNTPQHFLNALTTNITPFMLAYFFGPEIVGFYAISLRILTMPVTLISRSVGQVYYQKATEIYKAGNNLFNNLKRVTSGLVLIAVVPWLIFIIIAPNLFSVFLGDSWFEAGQYARWVALWMFFVYLNAPAVQTLIVLGLQKIQFYINIIFFLLRTSALIYGGLYLNPLNTIILFVLMSIISNVTIIITSFYCSKKGTSKRS